LFLTGLDSDFSPHGYFARKLNIALGQVWTCSNQIMGLAQQMLHPFFGYNRYD
jgi:hypothetical protein